MPPGFKQGFKDLVLEFVPNVSIRLTPGPVNIDPDLVGTVKTSLEILRYEKQ